MHHWACGEILIPSGGRLTWGRKPRQKGLQFCGTNLTRAVWTYILSWQYCSYRSCTTSSLWYINEIVLVRRFSLRDLSFFACYLNYYFCKQLWYRLETRYKISFFEIPIFSLQLLEGFFFGFFNNTLDCWIEQTLNLAWPGVYTKIAPSSRKLWVFIKNRYFFLRQSKNTHFDTLDEIETV